MLSVYLDCERPNLLGFPPCVGIDPEQGLFGFIVEFSAV